MTHYPKISVIVPIFNVEKVLFRCIDSILKQTFTDFELLLIDDGSTDKSGKICDDFASKDIRVHIFHKENGGVSSARNLGLSKAKGEWITFVDSDDWVNPNYLFNLYGHVIDDIDLIFSYATIYDGNSFKEESYKSVFLTKENFAKYFVENDLFWHTSPWSKLYKRTIIYALDLRFVENMHIGEDAVFLFNYMIECKVIKITSDTDYFYYYNRDKSLTKRINSFCSEYEGYKNIQAVVLKLTTLIGNDLRAKDKLEWILGTYTMRVLNSIYHEDRMRRNRRVSVIQNLDIKSYVKSVPTNNMKEKILIFLLRNGYVMLYDLIRTLKKNK